MPKLKRPWGVGTRVLSLCAALALPGGPAAASTEGITVEAAEFIVSVGDGEGGERRIASTLVPYLPDQACFGWRIRLAEAPPVVRVREVLKLPEAPAFSSGEDVPYSTHDTAEAPLVGQQCTSKCRPRWSPVTQQKTIPTSHSSPNEPHKS